MVEIEPFEAGTCSQGEKRGRVATYARVHLEATSYLNSVSKNIAST